MLTGKPSPFLIQDIVSTHGVTPQRMLMVGDRLDTDIAWGAATGMSTLLVMTGEAGALLMADGVAGSSTGVSRVWTRRCGLPRWLDVLEGAGCSHLPASLDVCTYAAACGCDGNSASFEEFWRPSLMGVHLPLPLLQV